MFKYVSLYALFITMAANNNQPMDCNAQLAAMKFERGKYSGKFVRDRGNVWGKLFGRTSVMGQMSGGTVSGNARGQMSAGEIVWWMSGGIIRENVPRNFRGKCPENVLRELSERKNVRCSGDKMLRKRNDRGIVREGRYPAWGICERNCP